MATRLSVKQKGQLALIVLVIYYPIFLYMALPLYNWEIIEKGIPFLIVDGIAIFLFFFIWLNVSEWILNHLFKKFGEDYIAEFNLLAQLVTFLISIVLAILFVATYRSTVHAIDYLQQQLFDIRFTIPFRSRKSVSAGALGLFKRGSNGFFIMLMMSGFYLIAIRRASLRLKEVHLKAEQLEKASIQSQFSALKNQVNPHFLFNSLSILSSLVHVDADLSEKFIGQLSKAYRYILEQKDNELVSLDTELEFIQAYIFLLKIRFEDKFQTDINVPEAYKKRHKIAPLTLQLLIENAVKHNQMSDENPLKVSIVVEKDELVVRNNLAPRPQKEVSTGVGLQNIMNRYQLLTDRKVWVGESEDSFIVRLPLL